MSDTLRVGDDVLWRGSFGMEEPKKVIVKGIQLNYSNGSKDGVAVDEIDWWHIQERNQIIDLDNGHWAWAFQIKPIEEYV